MKKTIIIYFIVSLACLSIAFGASLNRDMPSRVSPGDEVTVTFRISDMEVGKDVGISEITPAAITVKEQKVTGSEGTPSYQVKDKTNHKWSFKASSSSSTVTYKFNAPTEVGSYNFDAVYALPPANINNIKSTLTVRVITCGDGYCEGAENSDNCEADCPKPAAPPVKKGVGGKLNVGLIIVVSIIVIGLIIYFLVARKKKTE